MAVRAEARARARAGARARSGAHLFQATHGAKVLGQLGDLVLVAEEPLHLGALAQPVGKALELVLVGVHPGQRRACVGAGAAPAGKRVGRPTFTLAAPTAAPSRAGTDGRASPRPGLALCTCGAAARQIRERLQLVLREEEALEVLELPEGLREARQLILSDVELAQRGHVADGVWKRRQLVLVEEELEHTGGEGLSKR